jgi:hypothetical protein
LQIQENIGKWKLLKCGNCKLPFSLSFEKIFLLIPSTNKKEEILNLPTFSSTFGINILQIENEIVSGRGVAKNSQKYFFVQQKFTSMFETEKFEMQKRIKKFEMEQKKLFDLKFKNALTEKERIIQVISGLPISNEKQDPEESEIEISKEKVKTKQKTSEKKEFKIKKSTIPKVKEINNTSDDIFSFDQEDSIQQGKVILEEEASEEEEEEIKPQIEEGIDQIQEEEIRKKREEFLYSSSVPVNIPVMKKISKEEEENFEEEKFSYIERYEEIRK